MYLLSLISLCYMIVTTAEATGKVADKGVGAGGGGLNPRSVNINLETVFEFDPKDNFRDVEIIDNIQQFLGKVKTAIDNKTGRRSYLDSRPKRPKPENVADFKDLKPEKFTDFIGNVIEVLRNYSDNDLEDVVAVADNEFRKYHYQGCKFHELVQNIDLRRFVASKLSTVQNKQGKDIKKSLHTLIDALEEAKYDYKQVELLDYIDSLYRHTDRKKMESFLSQIQAYAAKSKRTDLSLVRIIRNGIRNIIFDHYSNLNPNARRELRIKIETFWRDVETTPETTTTKNTFNLVKDFDFLRDFNFGFVTPENITENSTPINKKPKSTRKPKTTKNPKTSLQTKKRFIDLSKLRINSDPEEIPNYTDREESKDKESKKSKNNESKVKRERKKKKGHKRKKTHNRAHITVTDEDSAFETKHKSKNHKNDYVFRQHKAMQPRYIFDYEAVINVKRQTEESHSIERKKSKSIDVRRYKTISKKKPTNFRKFMGSRSEEGLSIDFETIPLKYEHTTKVDETILRRLNDLEKVVETFKPTVYKNDSNKENKVVSNKKISTVKITEDKQSPITEASLSTNKVPENITRSNGNKYNNSEYSLSTNNNETCVSNPAELNITISEVTEAPLKYSETNNTFEDKWPKIVLRTDEHNEPPSKEITMVTITEKNQSHTIEASPGTNEEIRSENYTRTDDRFINNNKNYTPISDYNETTVPSTEELNNTISKFIEDPSKFSKTNNSFEEQLLEMVHRSNDKYRQNKPLNKKVSTVKMSLKKQSPALPSTDVEFRSANSTRTPFTDKNVTIVSNRDELNNTISKMREKSSKYRRLHQIKQKISRRGQKLYNQSGHELL